MRSSSLQCLLLTILSCVFLLSTAQNASACSCGGRPTVLDAFDGSDEVVTSSFRKLEETVTIEGVLRYSDGTPAVEEWVKF